MTNGARVIAVDPSLRRTGIVVFDVVQDGEQQRVRLLSAEVVRTEGMSDEEAVDAIGEAVVSTCLRYRPTRAVVERPLGAQSARAAHALGLGFGATRAALNEARSIGTVIDSVTAHEVKKAVGGVCGRSSSDSKAAVETALRRSRVIDRVDETIDELRPPSLREHAWDALGAGIHVAAPWAVAS